jgi:type II secretory pathway component PulF
MALILTPGQLSSRSEYYHQLGQLTAAGVPLVKGLDMLRRKPPGQGYSRPIAEILDHLGHGETFSGSLQRLGSWTPSFDIALIGAGEQSGRLDVVFRLLGAYYTDRARLLRQMISDMLYPMFVFHMALFLFPFIRYFSGAISLEGFFLRTIGVLIPIYGLVFAITYSMQGRHGSAWRSFLERVLSPVPVLGTARHYLALARVTAALDALINAGITIIEAWEIAATASGSPAMGRVVKAWKPALQSGTTPAEAVNASGYFPELFCNLYQTGEVSGQLDESLRRMHTYFQEEGTRKLHLLAQWVPRFLYLCIALMVAYRVIHFYLDYFDQVRKAGGF